VLRNMEGNTCLISLVRTVRKASVAPTDRDIFERYGETVMQMMIAANFEPRAEELKAIYPHQNRIEDARHWLNERADKAANHEWRIEIVEWSIFAFVVLGVVLDIVRLVANR
jgi:hypothetical protein